MGLRGEVCCREFVQLGLGWLLEIGSDDVVCWWSVDGGLSSCQDGRLSSCR